MSTEHRAELDSLMPELYDELKAIASRRLRSENPDHTLQTTALVHEAYLRLAQAGSVEVRSRPELLGLAAKAMRRILVDHARSRRRHKRGGDLLRVTLSDAWSPHDDDPVDFLAVDEALIRLARIEPRAAETVELRFIGGLTVEETARALGVSPRTVKRDNQFAQAWLARELAGGSGR